MALPFAGIIICLSEQWDDYPLSLGLIGTYINLELNLIFHGYSDDHLGSTELTAKLEPAFLSGLRCPIVQIRSKFFAIFDSSVQKRIFDRLLYIVCSQNWEQCAGYFWIKHCLEVKSITIQFMSREDFIQGDPRIPSPSPENLNINFIHYGPYMYI